MEPPCLRARVGLLHVYLDHTTGSSFWRRSELRNAADEVPLVDRSAAPAMDPPIPTFGHTAHPIELSISTPPPPPPPLHGRSHSAPVLSHERLVDAPSAAVATREPRGLAEPELTPGGVEGESNAALAQPEEDLAAGSAMSSFLRAEDCDGAERDALDQMPLPTAEPQPPSPRLGAFEIDTRTDLVVLETGAAAAASGTAPPAGCLRPHAPPPPLPPVSTLRVWMRWAYVCFVVAAFSSALVRCPASCDEARG